MPLFSVALLLCLAAGVTPLRSGAQQSSLSDSEVEKLRDTAASAPDRIMAFVAFIDQRTVRLEKLSSSNRVPGREEDTHELFQQIASILDDLDDNLDDYSKRHLDIRRVLPKLIAATERWGTQLKSPAEDESYNLSRRLALDSLQDVHESAVKMVDEQKAWFAAHPPGKEPVAKKE